MKNSYCFKMFTLRVALWLGCCALLISAQGCKDNVSINICSYYASQCNSLIPFFRTYMAQNCKKFCNLCQDTGPSWNEWTTYSNCDVTCGGGTQMRTRTCTVDNGCDGSNTETRPCENQLCPIWGDWYAAGQCSKSCGGGLRQERRDCMQGDCVGEDSRNVLACNEQDCPAVIGDFSVCSTNCGIGYQTRTTSCGNQCSNIEHRSCPTASDCQCQCQQCEDSNLYAAFCSLRVATNRLQWCGGSAVQQACQKSCGICDSNCNCNADWDEWGDWSFCSVTCGTGTRLRFRNCNILSGCPGGQYYMMEQCQREPCTGTFVWGSWQIGPCGVTCGSGTREDRRECESGFCEGSNTRERPCTERACPVWGNWDLGECSVTCGNGERMDRRDCMNEPGCQLENGVGNTRTVQCTGKECPYWGEWDFGECSVSCGGGERTDTRMCENGPGCQRENGIGNTRTEPCNDDTCPEWSDWSEGTCSRECGGGRRTDTRRCRNGNNCQGDSERTVDCNEQACPEWSVWRDSGTCSKTCGPGMITQTRFCINGQGCEGDNSQSIDCNQGECNNPVWGPWTRDDDCDVTCGGGTRRESRNCIDGPGCDGDTSRVLPCGEQPCPEWGPWKSGKCPVTCGGGMRTDTRECQNGPGCLPPGEDTREQPCNDNLCPVWGPWVEAACPVTCGGGTKKDTRECMNGSNCKPANGGSRDVECSTNLCPSWGPWEIGECPVTCGGGTRTDTRQCMNGDDCQGDNTRTAECATDLCPSWGPWEIGECPVTCGGGTRTDTRQCMNGDDCQGDNTRTAECATELCPSWGPWKIGECPVTCGGGTRTDTRQCMNGDDCQGDNTRTAECATDLCPSWGPWEIGECPVTCGGGTRTDTRQCMNGDDCQGDDTRTAECATELCPNMLGQWTPWTPWSTCDNTCGRKERTRTRTCPGDIICIGDDTEEDSCPVGSTCDCTCPEDSNCKNVLEPFCSSLPLNLCPQHPWYRDNCPKRCKVCGKCDPCGTWNDWRPWSDCSTTCGAGSRSRTRTCPQGTTCNGPEQSSKVCILADCGPQWTEWSSWNSCSRDCDGGSRSRTRQCEVSRVGACGSPAAGSQTEDCNTLSCDRTWRPWGVWSSCSVTCGAGQEQRMRTCRGRSCEGESTDRRGCNNGVCLVFNQWSACSRSCGRGTQTMRGCRDCAVSYRDCENTMCRQATCTRPLINRYGSRSFECCDLTGVTGRSCGISVNPGRIIGGVNAAAKRWPWMVFLKPTDDALCGGILITKYLVLTAAHCVEGVALSGIEIILGALTYSDSSAHVQRRRAKLTYVHEDYAFPANDIALIQLDEPAIVGGDFVRTICLPKGERVPDDLSCIATGWGLTSASDGSSVAGVLQEVELRTLPFGVCTKGYADAAFQTRQRMNEGIMLCAGKISGGIDTCNGDSGGPLMCQRCSTCQWFVTGLTSFGDTNCGASGRPGVYTRVSRYEGFINEVIEKVFRSVPAAEKSSVSGDRNLASGNYETCS